MSRRSGFTLVELLVALAIFAIVAGFAYRSLDSMLQTRVALEQQSRKWRDVSLLIARMERDLAAVLPMRTAVAPEGTTLMPVSSLVQSTSSDVGLAVSRSGSPLQENSLAAPQRVAYRLKDNNIERLSWGGIDAAPRDEPVATPILRNVTSLTFRFLDAKGEWQTTWGPPGNAQPQLLTAVEITVQLASGEKIVRLIDIPRTQ
jgi:general secretion pathway protein J